MTPFSGPEIGELYVIMDLQWPIYKRNPHVYLNSVQQMVSGELAGEGLQTGFSRHGLPPRAPLDTVYPLREHLNSVQRMVSGGYCEGLFPDTVCWTRLRNTWNPFRAPFAMAQGALKGAQTKGDTPRPKARFPQRIVNLWRLRLLLEIKAPGCTRWGSYPPPQKKILRNYFRVDCDTFA